MKAVALRPAGFGRDALCKTLWRLTLDIWSCRRRYAGWQACNAVTGRVRSIAQNFVPKDFWRYMDVLVFVEATIYQMDEENERLAKSGLAPVSGKLQGKEYDPH